MKLNKLFSLLLALKLSSAQGKILLKECAYVGYGLLEGANIIVKSSERYVGWSKKQT